MTDAEKRMLKIKIGSVSRLKKELGLYVEEREKERQRVARMKEEGADSHDIKHAVSTWIRTTEKVRKPVTVGLGPAHDVPCTLQEAVLEEATLMIPDTRQRLEGALQDLSNFSVRALFESRFCLHAVLHAYRSPAAELQVTEVILHRLASLKMLRAQKSSRPRKKPCQVRKQRCNDQDSLQPHASSCANCTARCA